MRFFKGMLWGGLLSTGVWIMHNEKMYNKNRIIKKGKQFVRKLGSI